MIPRISAQCGLAENGLAAKCSAINFQTGGRRRNGGIK